MSTIELKLGYLSDSDLKFCNDCPTIIIIITKQQRKCEVNLKIQMSYP